VIVISFTYNFTIKWILCLRGSTALKKPDKDLDHPSSINIDHFFIDFYGYIAYNNIELLHPITGGDFNDRFII
jgi:hypothetical protein